MPDHLHLMMTLLDNDANYSLRINLIKGTYSRLIKNKEKILQSRLKKRERNIWQRRFWEHVIRDEDDFEKHIDYIHYNPIKHGYVKNPSDWKFSSIHRYVAQGILPTDWAGDVDNNNGFGE